MNGEPPLYSFLPETADSSLRFSISHVPREDTDLTVSSWSHKQHCCQSKSARGQHFHYLSGSDKARSHFGAEMDISQICKEWFYLPSQVSLFSYIKGYKSACKSVVAAPERAGSGISIAAVTNRVVLLLRLSVVVPMPQKCSWSGGCSNCCARQCEDTFLRLLSVT